jgi:hypothetical protein
VNVDVAVDSKSQSHVRAFVGKAPMLVTRAVIVASELTVGVTASIDTASAAGAGDVTFTSTVAVPVTVPVPFATDTFAMKIPAVGYVHVAVIADVKSVVGGVFVSQSHDHDVGGAAPLTRVTVAVSVVELPAAMVAGDAASATV